MPETKMQRTRFEHASPILCLANLASSVRYYVDTLGFTNADWAMGDFTWVTRDAASIYLSEGGQGLPGTPKRTFSGSVLTQEMGRKLHHRPCAPGHIREAVDVDQIRHGSRA